MIQSFNWHVSRVDEVFKLVELVPNFSAVYWGWCYHKILYWVEVSFICVCEVWVIFEEIFEFIRLGFKLTIFVLKHTNRSSSMYDQHPTLIFVSNNAFIFLASMYLLVKTYFTNKLFVDLCLIHFAIFCLFINFI